MKLQYFFFILAIGSSNQVKAGHGFFNSFEGINWLSEPGLTPDQFVYILDDTSEKFQLSSSNDPVVVQKYYMNFAEEKLAESIWLLKRGNKNYHSEIERKYTSYLTDLHSSFTAHQSAEGTNYQQYCAERLLQHMYILSIEVLAVEPSMKEYFLSLNKIASSFYDAIIDGLNQDFIDSHFFKKEELKWSWEITLDPD